MSMDREQIFRTSKKLPTMPVTVKDWGGKFLINTLSGHERNEYELVVAANRDKNNVLIKMDGIQASLVILSLLNLDGTHVFKTGDVKKVEELSGAVLDYLFDVSTKFNKLTEEAVDEDIKKSKSTKS